MGPDDFKELGRNWTRIPAIYRFKNVCVTTNIVSCASSNLVTCCLDEQNGAYLKWLFFSLRNHLLSSFFCFLDPHKHVWSLFWALIISPTLPFLYHRETTNGFVRRSIVFLSVVYSWRASHCHTISVWGQESILPLRVVFFQRLLHRGTMFVVDRIWGSQCGGGNSFTNTCRCNYTMCSPFSMWY